ncbi:threonine synthase [Reticulibacter mediterranei]|uniref:Threonine synthase n=2 Tax=Reticulibacter mediterranei TaxID=2778369 RepID=A0A8J3IPZ6_9CHLR|nr:threonine synthase [Reticulibacter mediterranei]
MTLNVFKKPLYVILFFMDARFSYLSHLKCSACDHIYDADQLQTISPCCARPLLACYDLATLAKEVSRDEISHREATMWRYHEFLPVREPAHIISLGEGMTPLLHAPCLAPQGLEQQARLFVKDEGQNPTGSFKARGMSAAVSRAVELGVQGLVTPTAGNAGAALAAYAARAGLPSHVVAPKDAPHTCIQQARLYGGEVHLIPGLITDAGRAAAETARQRDWFNVATLREPYRAEGKKTMGLELAEQLGWRLPSAIIYPAGGGTGVVGMWKAFAELRAAGWIANDQLPKMIIVQAEGCAPLVRAFHQGKDEADAWPADEAHTQAAGLRVPSAIGDRLILQAVYESGGTALTVSDDSMQQMVCYAAKRAGMLIALEAAATLAAYHTLLATNFLQVEDEVVAYFTGSGLPDLQYVVC